MSAAEPQLPDAGTQTILGGQPSDVEVHPPKSRSTAASPYSTAGGGTRLEHRLGALFLARLITEAPVLELGERPPTKVAFQQAPAARVDDLVVTAAAADGVSSVRLEIAVRRTPKFMRSDKPTTELVATLVAADIDAEHDADPLVDRRIAVAVSGFQSHAGQVAELVSLARAQSTAADFFQLVRTPGKFACRSRLAHLLDMVKAALSDASDADSAEQRCWSLLRRLWIMQTQLETGHEETWTAVVDDLKHIAIDGSIAQAIALRDRLEQLAGEFDKSAGAVNAAVLRRHLHGQVAPGAHAPPPGWDRLVAVDRQARSAAARSVAGPGLNELTLTRAPVRDQLRVALAVGGDLVVKGDSGVGKSALVMDTIEQDVPGGDRQTLALNLRHLPSSYLDLLALLLSPLDTLFAELTAPKRLLVIDSAEAASETHADVFSQIVRAARAKDMSVVAVTTTEGSATVIELMKQSGTDPRELIVRGLDDDELREASRSFPVLERLVANPRARELLRRPIVIDLLCRSGDPGLPLSDAQALDHIWHHLVRNANRLDAGSPNAREQVMLRLARHALRPGDVDGLLRQLDHATVEGLRRSGLLLPASQLPWELVPAFHHDLVRAYAVARLLLADRDPAAALTACGAPRWALPSARLACEILLGAPDDPAYPWPGRLLALQESFDSLVAGGYGERWSDVPTEAALSLPDSSNVLQDAWQGLVADKSPGVTRVVRVLRARHQRDGVVDPVAAEPVVALLLRSGPPPRVAEDVASLTSDWLRAHVLRATPAGQTTRVRLREKILGECADRESALDKQETQRQAELAARPPEQVAADEARRRQFAGLPRSPLTGRGLPGLTAPRHRPYEWIDDAQIEHLALLGPDLGPAGEGILRRIAADEPHSLDHAVEAVFAGHALSAHDPRLLLDLVEAYYVEQEEDDEDGLGWSGGLLDDGIRDHRAGGYGPLASFTHGPFLAMFRTDYRGGVSLLNRMLDHAARVRVRHLMNNEHGIRAAEIGEVLSITGEPREFAGDGHVWLWYRGTGVGPYPCMSALQALEFVTEEAISAGVPPKVLTDIMTASAHNLAMPALALAVLVRHLDEVGDAIDPYLVEPLVWHLEFSRAIADQMGGLAARLPELPHPDRRGWSLREVGMMLAITAEGDRIGRLKEIGDRLEHNARISVGDDTSTGARQHLAAVRNWAASLDRAAYELQQQDDHVVIQQTVDPEVEQVLAETNADLRRTNDAVGLVVRHAHVRDNGGRAPDTDTDVLAADLDLARNLLDDPPQTVGFTSDGPVAVAATAVELHLTSRVNVPLEDLIWSATVLLEVAADVAKRPPDTYDDSFFSQGADRSAARALPFILLPTARELRDAMSVDGSDDVDELITLSRGVAVDGDNETRLAYARALDAVWAAPCDADHLHGRCHHRVAFDLVRDSAMQSVFGSWDQQLQRRPLIRLDPPHLRTLDTVVSKDIYVRRLTPALRAAGAAAASAACCSDDARAAVRSLLAAHQRGMLSRDRGYQHSDSDSLVAARASLWQATTGDDKTIVEYVRAYLGNSRLLAEGLRAIAAAAEEREDAGRQARRLWPQIMDLVLDEAHDQPQLFTQRSWGAYAQAYLIPNPSATTAYLTVELSRDPFQWRDLLAWEPQIVRWLSTAAPQRMSVDQLVIAVRDLDVSDQVDHGLAWIETAVIGSSTDCASTFTLPQWLHDRLPDITAETDKARWQRVIDLLLVAGDTRVADLAD